jgi:hypothetical protein
VKKIRISVNDEVYRRAQIVAAERETSVPALINVFLTALAREKPEAERLKRAERILRDRITRFRADSLARDELYNRGR